MPAPVQPTMRAHRPAVPACLVGTVLLFAADAPDRAPRRPPSRWWQRVEADISRFHRPITDPARRSKPTEKPLIRRGRCFCPHPDRSPLRVRRILLSPPGTLEPTILTIYYCEIEGLYWTHVTGGAEHYNLVTGPWRLGVPSPQTQPATRPAASRPAGVLRLILERPGAPRAVPAGASPRLALVFLNTGAKPIRVNTNPDRVKLRLEVRGPGVEAEPVPPAEPPGPARAGDFIRVPPGGRHRQDLPALVDGAHRYRLTLPGAYLVRLTYRNEERGPDPDRPAWVGTVTTPPIIVRVVGPPRPR